MLLQTISISLKETHLDIYLMYLHSVNVTSQSAQLIYTHFQNHGQKKSGLTSGF